ncbi:MAG: GIY-YIG nuclease family protein [Candidatus Cloacimonetes bacterium]|nr:GIY-YIG nuclease family protein [Candidatus Cloacimonadota bacterium]MBT7468823.1 GIY-YIG nuclease family protein [Candidatus Cloacimonadota bacterium]
MYYTYILYSEHKDKYYVGYTHDIALRLARHNAGWSKSTKSGIPWQVVYFEKYATKSEATKRESAIKHKKSRKYIEALIK